MESSGWNLCYMFNLAGGARLRCGITVSPNTLAPGQYYGVRLIISRKTITMKNIKFLGAAGALLAVLAPSMASAQDVQKPVTLKLGAFFPANSDVKRAVGNTWFSAGLEYAFPKPAAVTNSPLSALTPLIYVDYTGKSKDIDGGTVDARTVNVGVGVKYYAPAAAGTVTTTHPYIGAGIAAAVVHAKSSQTFTDGEAIVTSSVTKDQTNFGFKINGGVEFAQNYLVDVAYWNSGKVQGTHLDGYAVSLGYKF